MQPLGLPDAAGRNPPGCVGFSLLFPRRSSTSGPLSPLRVGQFLVRMQSKWNARVRISLMTLFPTSSSFWYRFDAGIYTWFPERFPKLDPVTGFAFFQISHG